MTIQKPSPGSSNTQPGPAGAGRDIDVDKPATAQGGEPQVLSLIAHDLKNPLTSIKGYTELLASQAPGPVNAQQTVFLRTILANVERMQRLLAFLNDYAQLEAGRLVLSPEPFHLKDAFTTAMKPLAGLLEARCFRVNIPAELPDVLADRAHLAQILNALILNSVMYSTEGSQADVVVWQEPSTEKLAPVHIRFSDSGAGITPEEEAHLFEAFYRSPRPEIRQAPGIGLSLHAARRILALQEGSIAYQRPVGEGTVFEITLPVAQPAA